MRSILIAVCGLLLASTGIGCGNLAVDAECIGQVKYVRQETPLIMSDWKSASVSMGVMQDGTGSISSEDKVFYVEKESHYNVLKQAAESGELVRIKYDHVRFRWNVEKKMVKDVEIIKRKSKQPIDADKK